MDLQFPCKLRGLTTTLLTINLVFNLNKVGIKYQPTIPCYHELKRRAERIDRNVLDETRTSNQKANFGQCLWTYVAKATTCSKKYILNVETVVKPHGWMFLQKKVPANKTLPVFGCINYVDISRKTRFK